VDTATSRSFDRVAILAVLIVQGTMTTPIRLSAHGIRLVVVLALFLGLARPLGAFPEAVVSEKPPLPSWTERVAKAALVPAWAAYDIGQPQAAGLSAMADFMLSAGILDLSQSRERFAHEGLRGILIAGLIAHHAVAVLIAAQDDALLQGAGTGSIETGRAEGLEAVLGLGDYLNTRTVGLAYSFEHLRLSAALGDGWDRPEYSIPDTGSRTHGETLEREPIFRFGIEGRWRLNPLVRVQPGVQFLTGILTRQAWIDSAHEEKPSAPFRESRGLWVIPSLALGLDPFRFISFTLGTGWEAVRPGTIDDFESLLRAHGGERAILPRLRFSGQAEMFF
jgi:hypothetical protein